MKIADGTLTEQELQAAYLARHDLGPGYPQLDVPPYVRRLYLDSTAEDLSLKFAPTWSPEKQAQVDADLEVALRRFLMIPEGPRIQIRSTFSGSIALDRALATAQLLARQRGKKKIAVITTTPCIDIMKLFLLERADVKPAFVASNKNGALGVLDAEAVLQKLAQVRAKDEREHIVVLVCSPENPTGSIWSEQDLMHIARECAAADATLIVDHCFAVAGVHHPKDVAAVWSAASELCDWIGIWDTGKTFGLNEDKLGFLISGDAETSRAIDAALAVVQFGVARRAKIFFSELFRLATYYDHVRELNELCANNLETLERLVGPSFDLFPTKAGSLALIDVSRTGEADEAIRKRLLSNGVGTVAGSIFFHSSWKPEHYIRLALARRADYFEEAVMQMMQVLS
ncbi:aminotransferase class I/II-fold pyridoxal phosphate-dependent enzyme [Terricaulis silvestris]|uniref:Methionine aminotransferase n=1 Tax=Terricaulis silvestris TaxID=2686094 RepID=A0A6I6MY97_9CAUL|nr:aminotransferase class I/II-fold pyridoxal phosphate-dependent enzyme [Terricaulis silvestris]QGZ96622.1 methionine aminotransferase [Terricaulis silvestris]